MINPSAINTISDLRFKTKKVLEKMEKTPVFLFYRSTPKGVLLSYKTYEELINLIEDYYISLKAEEYEKEDKSKIKWISHEKIYKILKLHNQKKNK